MNLFQRLFGSKNKGVPVCAQLPAGHADEVVGMITNRERGWFRNYAATTYTGAGAIVDLGCFVGSSTIAFAEGLLANDKVADSRVHAYDRFVWNDFFKAWWEKKALPSPRVIDDSILAEFLHRTSRWKDQIVVHQEDLNRTRWNGAPIEFLLIDAMKSAELAEAIARAFYPYLMPGVSYVAHQDFWHYFTSWIHLLQFRLRDCFEVVADVPKSGTVVFRCLKTPTADDLSGLPFSSAPSREIEEAFAYSLGLVSEDKWPNIIAAKAMAYIHRGELDKAQELLKETYAGTQSLGLEKVRAILAQRFPHPV
jgi:hypothetical protein